MKSTAFALASVLVAAVVAQPHRHQQHHHHNKRQDVVWVTDWVYDYTTVDTTTTVWVSSGFIPPTSTGPPGAATTIRDAVPAQFFQSLESLSSSSSSSSVHVAPTPSKDVAPVVIATTPPVAVPAPVTTPAAPVAVAPTPVAAPAAPAAPAVAAPAVAAPAVAPDSSSSSSSSGGTSSGCTSGSPCTGDITYYQAGLGACGWTNDGDTENVVALPHGLMGTQSNGNPYCGQTITITCIATGKTTTAKVVDKCMGCVGDSIDLSNAAFLELDDLSVGRTEAKWWFN